MRRESESVISVHASAVVVEETGILIRGPAGAGKTTLAMALVANLRRAERFGRLVADDTVLLQVFADRLVGRPHPRTAGLVERRGLGITPVEHEPACVVRLIADLIVPNSDAEQLARLPEPDQLRTALLGVVLPRLALPSTAPTLDNADRVLEFCRMFRPGS